MYSVQHLYANTIDRSKRLTKQKCFQNTTLLILCNKQFIMYTTESDPRQLRMSHTPNKRKITDAQKLTPNNAVYTRRLTRAMEKETGTPLTQVRARARARTSTGSTRHDSTTNSSLHHE